MNYLANFFPDYMQYGAWAILIAILMLCFYQNKKKPIPLTSIITAIILLCLLWMIHISFNAGERAGMSFHLLGATLITLFVGFFAAIWVFTLATIIFVVFFLGWENLPIIALTVLTTGLPAICLTKGLLLLTRRYLPHHLFIFIFCNAFFTAALGVLFSALVSIGLIAIVQHNTEIWHNTFPIFFLLMWGDAFLTGLLTAIAIAFAPQLLAEYSDDIYLPKDAPLF